MLGDQISSIFPFLIVGQLLALSSETGCLCFGTLLSLHWASAKPEFSFQASRDSQEYFCMELEHTRTMFPM